MAITLTYARQRLDIEVPAEDFARVPLRSLQSRASDFTGIPPERIKLLFAGGIMRNLDLPLSAYGIGPGAKIMVMGSKESADDAPPTASNGQSDTSAAETKLAANIAALVDTALEPLQPRLAVFERMMEGLPQRSSLTEQQLKDLRYQQAFLAEKLMQGLLSVDGVHVPHEFATARETRRAAVKKLQGLLDKVDALGQKLKAK
ncbi:hypothetical protein RI367_000652 [Sorochytrium milnesiophthora]